MSDELKPCPFCGGLAEIVDIDEGENAGGSCVCCTTCLASSKVEFGFKENFISNWNRRVQTLAPDAVARLVEAAKWVRDQSCEGFCRDLPRDDYYDKEMDMDCAGCRVRAALAAMEANHDRT